MDNDTLKILNIVVVPIYFLLLYLLFDRRVSTLEHRIHELNTHPGIFNDRKQSDSSIPEENQRLIARDELERNPVISV